MLGKHTRYLGFALGALLLVPAAESAAQSRTRAPKTARCYGVSVSSPELAAKRRRRPSFSAAEIMDLQLRAYVSRKMSGQHRLEFRVYTPNGNLYQSMVLPFDPDTAAPDTSARSSRRFQQVSTVLPVAGTSIVSSSMYGTWRIEAYLDDAEESCARARKFVIKP